MPVILTASDPETPPCPGPMIPELTDAFADPKVIARTSIGAWNDVQDAALLRMSAAGIVPVSWIATAAELQHDWSLPGSEDLAALLQHNISRGR